jgi:chemotaxis protein histidine kinase CheA/CheY-like chemotaxis protein
MRVDVKYLDSLNNLVGELVVNRNLLEQDQERLQQFITNLLHQVQLLSDVSQRMRDQYDRSLLEASLSAGRGGRSYSSSFESVSYSGDGENSNNSVSNDFEGIEFDRYNTFHVLSQEIIELIVRVRESASDIEFVVGETDQVTRQLGTITTQVQDDLKQSRMVPFAQIGDRLPRGIRDRALKTGKQAELEIFGRETLIDKAILEQLTDPLTHLVNNAIDHGLEDPVTRQAAGKSATGRLTVRAYHQGNQTVISISDDGAGISTDKVKKSAVAKGVRSQSEVNRLNDTEVYGLLFEAGFSTAAQADEFKGRGVGLDVVKTCLDDIRGVIIVESVVGKGTTFTIRLPLTLSISKAMFCISDRGRIAFPVDGFEDMVEVPQNQIVLDDKGQPCLPWRDTVLPFQHLSNLLSYSRHISRSSIYGKQENDELCIIILRNDTSYLALQVDQFLGEYEIVIKQLEGPIPQPAGIAGATVLGDGRVMAIANVLELFDIASGRLRPSTSSITIKPMVEEEVAADPTVLIVDDSITVRELLSLTFAKVGYRVEQAKDGQDAWEKLRAGLPCDMIFCDIEMPRMDGLDLLSRLQKDARLKDIPVAMLTSRGADRHRQSAIQLGAKGYFTKPYLEEELLSASKRLLAGETLPI